MFSKNSMNLVEHAPEEHASEEMAPTRREQRTTIADPTAAPIRPKWRRKYAVPVVPDRGSDGFDGAIVPATPDWRDREGGRFIRGRS